MVRSSVFRWMFVTVSLAAVPLACSASNQATSAGGSGGDGASQSTQSTSHGTGQGGAGIGGSFTVGSGGGDPSCPVHCSGDLHQVLDCHDTLVTTCGDTQGCGPGGTCIDACASAQANGSTIGCEFYAVVPAPESTTRGSCFAALLANTWKTPITIQAEYAGKPLDVAAMARVPVGSGPVIDYQSLPNGQLAAGQIAVLFLAQAPSGGFHFTPCPAGVTAGVAADPSIAGTGIGSAFRITTSAPVVAYDIYPYGGATSYVTSATLLVPTAAWGTNYVAADGYEADTSGSPSVQAVALDDATQITISPVAAIAGGTGVPATGAGQPVTYTLNRGQALQLLQPDELSGSPVQANKPFGLWGGSSCMNIPHGKLSCDSGHQQLLPVKALGHEYVAVRYRDRVPGAGESVPWTVVGAVDDTTLTYDPAPPAGAPTTLASGQTAMFFATDPFVVKSQDDGHPFYLSGHMSSWTALPSNPGNLGDPEYVSVIPPQQYLSRYLFLTDVTYGNTHLVFVRAKAEDGTFKDVSLDCAGTLGGWQPVGASGAYELARVDLVAGGAPVGNCTNGVHTAQSEAPFGLTVWGWDYAVSYAYPAGMGTHSINTVVVPPVPK